MYIVFQHILKNVSKTTVAENYECDYPLQVEYTRNLLVMLLFQNSARILTVCISIYVI